MELTREKRGGKH